MGRYWNHWGFMFASPHHLCEHQQQKTPLQLVKLVSFLFFTFFKLVLLVIEPRALCLPSNHSKPYLKIPLSCLGDSIQVLWDNQEGSQTVLTPEMRFWTFRQPEHGALPVNAMEPFHVSSWWQLRGLQSSRCTLLLPQSFVYQVSRVGGAQHDGNPGYQAQQEHHRAIFTWEDRNSAAVS